MAKQGMKRPEINDRPKNTVAPVPEIQGKAKHGHNKAAPIIAGTKSPSQKVYHHTPAAYDPDGDRPISQFYPEIDNDLAPDNIENDIPEGDLQDL